jgi:hypothetical protein
MPLIDFDALRGEQTAKPFQIKVGGKVYDLPPSMPASVALIVNRLHLGAGDQADVTAEQAIELCEALFGADKLEIILRESQLPVTALPDLVGEVMKEYMKGLRSPNRATRRAKASRR